MSRGATSPGFQLPPAAVSWLTAAQPVRVLTLSGAGLPRAVARYGHEVFAIDKSQRVVEQIAAVGIVAVAAQAEQLPFNPCQFDAVLNHQVFHRYAPGLVLSEMARVLRPGGHVGTSYLVRDDSVPWVRRLLALVHAIDPEAMTGSFGAESVAEFDASKYFQQVEHKAFRHWVPVTRDELVAMAARLPAVQGLADSERTPFLSDIGALYDESAPGTEPLRLPYQLRCTRAVVNHAELTAPIEIDDSGLVIPL